MPLSPGCNSARPGRSSRPDSRLCNRICRRASALEPDVPVPGQPCRSLGTLLFCEAKAVTPFRNGRGLVSVEHEGRIVQLSARLVESQANMPVRVGDLLLVEEVNVAAQRVVVSVY